MKILVKFLVLGLYIGCVICADDVSTTTDSTTSGEKQDIPQEEVDNAMVLDVGRYTTLAFEYFNDQYKKKGNGNFNDTCIDEYIRCLMGLTAHIPVCGFNDPYNRQTGYFTTASYCEIYLDNCRREIRVWRIIDYGQCRFWHNGHRDDVFHTFRRNNYPLIVNILKILAIQPGNNKHDPNKLWPEPTGSDDWRKTQQWHDLPRPDEPYKNRNHPFIIDLLKMLATQRGNTDISVSKYDVPKPWPELFTERNWSIDGPMHDIIRKKNQLNTATQSGNIESFTAKYSVSNPWKVPSRKRGSGQLIVGVPIYNVARRNNIPLVVDLLKILATQPGNTEISASKYNVSSLWPEPSYPKGMELESNHFP